MINYSHLMSQLDNGLLSRLAQAIPAMAKHGLSTERYGDLPGWLQALEDMPNIVPSGFNVVDGVTIGVREDLSTEQYEKLNKSLKALIPWRKGPFTLFGTHIDTEWRSDWKWERIRKGISPLENRTVLDVGCGSGYHCWRMWGDGARRVIGIDPSPRFIVQFHQVKKYLAHAPVDILPAGIEQLPSNLNAFDTTFSMGVLYHRRSPLDHLRELKETLKPGGELVLETLIVDGPEGFSLIPEKRYAMMNNVWFLPSVPTLMLWLRRSGFTDIQCIDENVTSLDEQRATDWMQFQSLGDFLNKADHTKTCEGHPAPKRATLVATKPK